MKTLADVNKDISRLESGMLVAVLCNGEKFKELFRRGYDVHHLDGQIVYMVKKEKR
jgi:hypothetical protein